MVGNYFPFQVGPITLTPPGSTSISTNSKFLGLFSCRAKRASVTLLARAPFVAAVDLVKLAESTLCPNDEPAEDPPPCPEAQSGVSLTRFPLPRSLRPVSSERLAGLRPRVWHGFANFWGLGFTCCIWASLSGQWVHRRLTRSRVEFVECIGMGTS